VKRRSVGSTETSICAIGLGCAGMSGGYGIADDTQSLLTLSAADEQGIDFLDTSDAYGLGHNEELLGRFLRDRRSRFVIGTKFGLVGRPGASGTTINNSPAYIRKACDASLRRLGIDVIDLYYAQRRDPDVPIEEMVGAMADLVRMGKVRYIGLTEVLPDTLRRAHAVHPIAAVQSEYSLWARDPERQVLEVCRSLGITFIAFCPLGRAFLTGAIQTCDALEATDLRHLMPRFQSDALRRNVELVRGLEAFAARNELTCARVALAWLLAKYPNVVPIPGTKHPAHIVENAMAAGTDLTAQQVEELDRLFPPSAVVGDRYPPAARMGIETIEYQAAGTR
jgi:aryl-alcohol dehydrogenase-like predicted oxidoreductase